MSTHSSGPITRRRFGATALATSVLYAAKESPADRRWHRTGGPHRHRPCQGPALFVGRAGAGVRLIPEGYPANPSLSAIEPVSATAKRKLENGEHRPAPETYPARAEIPKITGQRNLRECRGFSSRRSRRAPSLARFQLMQQPRGAIDTLVKRFASMLGARGIRVNAVEPIDTNVDLGVCEPPQPISYTQSQGRSR
jgi:hypothetical protein